MMDALPSDTPIFCYYGDDFTGSTDALDALAAYGVPAVLFLEVPGAADLEAFAGCRAIGIAGDSRSRPPSWMNRVLPQVFERLREMGAPVVQYKVCSTFDSSPETGSIGCALEIGRRIFAVPTVPVVPAAPLLQRYVVFGHLFAAAGGAIHRIDRHPSMQYHPITPMKESDLRLHLGRQMGENPELIDVLSLRANAAAFDGAPAVLFDGLEPADMARSARWIWENRSTPQSFVVGSSGFTHGMLDYWRTRGWLPPAGALPRVEPTDRVLVLAGSCSPVTERQICHALRNGFHGIRFDPLAIAAGGYEERVATEAIALLSGGRNVIIYSALGPQDNVGVEDPTALATAMGGLLRRVVEGSRIRRVLIAGGDTASYAVRELGVSALTFAAPLAPGAPLCLAHGGRLGLELILKGGQVGSERFFEEALS
jgi:uncharacterized protein YgbK (DUF1537 family)